VEIVSIAIAEFTQAKFLGLQDPQSGPSHPTSDQLDIESWETRARLGMGSLLAAGCHGVMLLAGRDKKTQIRARELGH